MRINVDQKLLDKILVRYAEDTVRKNEQWQHKKFVTGKVKVLRNKNGTHTLNVPIIRCDEGTV